MRASNVAENLVGRVVKVVNRKKGNEMIERTSGEPFKWKKDAVAQTHRDNMKGIHEKHNAPEPKVYTWPHRMEVQRPTTEGSSDRHEEVRM